MYQIIKGDSLQVLIELADESVDAVITDPPYSSGGLHASSRADLPSKKYVQTGTKILRPEFHGDNKDQRSFLYWSILWLGECWRIAKMGAPICLFSDWRQLPVMNDALQGGGWVWRGIVPWDKTEAVRPVCGRFRNQAEYILWGSKGPMPTSRNVPVLPGVKRVIVKPKEKYHITGKPVELMEEVIKIVEPGGVILDPFAGSGSTGVAAKKLGYGFIGIEMSNEYKQIAEERLADAA